MRKIAVIFAGIFKTEIFFLLKNHYNSKPPIRFTSEPPILFCLPNRPQAQQKPSVAMTSPRACRARDFSLY
jgi:hypothetical protein